jgi:hypothetical protein
MTKNKTPAQRSAELSERHSERLLALKVTTSRLIESDDKLAAWMNSEEERRSSRRLQATQPGIRGELARVRSRRSWVEWDTEEIQREVTPPLRQTLDWGNPT